jgi:GT2 family glycosyltransferase
MSDGVAVQPNSIEYTGTGRPGERAATARVASHAFGLDVIIVSYNTLNLTLQAIQSVLAADWSFGVLTVFVVDNQSSDGTVDAIRSTFPAVQVIDPKENLGFSRANNRAMARSRGDYVLLLNPDTIVSKESLVEMKAYLDRHEDVGMATCKLQLADGRLDLACRRSIPSMWDGFCRASGLSHRFPKSRLFARYNLTYLDENETYDVDAVNGAFMFCRRAAVDQVGPLDEDFFMYGEDLDWCFRFRKAGWRIVYHPATTTIHLKGQSSGRKSVRMIDELFRSNEIFARKHFFPKYGPLRRLGFLTSNNTWRHVTLLRNSLRKAKRAQP